MSSAPGAGEEALRLEARRRIYEHIAANPGCHLRHLQRALDLASGNLEYHLDFLERRRLVTAEVQDHYKRYFAAAGVRPEAKPLLALLRQRTPRRILVALLERPMATHGAVAAAVGVPPSSLAYHMRKLLRDGAVGVERAGRESRFWVVDPGAVVDLLVTYRGSFLDALVDRFLATFTDLDHGYLHGAGRSSGEGAAAEERGGAPPW